MSGREQFMDEQTLDALLGEWLSEGAATAPDRIAEQALLEVATTPQERNWLGAIQSSMASAPVAWVAAIVALAVGIGLLIGPRLVGDEPTPVPEPSPTASPGSDDLSLVVDDANAYQLLVPATWEEVDSGAVDARRWAGADGELTISYGTSIVEGGMVTLCYPPLPGLATCEPVEFGYSTPVVPEDYTGPIVLDDYLNRCDGGCPVASSGETTLDGEPAGLARQVLSDLQATYVSTFHNYRPIILYWAEPIDVADEARVQAMLESFEFTDSGPPPLEDPTELLTYTDPDGAYEMLVPRTWLESAASVLDPNREPYPGIQIFGQDGADTGTPGLLVSIGRPDGSAEVNCQIESLLGPGPYSGTCDTVVTPTVDELAEALISVPLMCADFGGDGVPLELANDFVLSGNPGRVEWPGYPLAPGPYADIGIGEGMSGNCLGLPLMRYHAFAIAGGRPIVLAFDYWNIGFARFDDEYVVQMLESFTLLD